MNATPDFSHLADTLISVAGDCRDRPELRAELDADPHAFLSSRGMNLPADAELRVAANTPEVFHLVLPSNPNTTVSDETLSTVAGGTSAAPNCASSVSSIPSCVGCASSVPMGG